jgi:hypothetical protein
MEQFMAANTTELARADAKAAVLLGFTGAVLGAFVAGTRAPGGPATGWEAVLWWSGVACALLSTASFVWALVPRRRPGSTRAGPAFFAQVADAEGPEDLGRAFRRLAADPAGPLLASVRRTSEIIRTKYRCIETGVVLLLTALPQFAVLVRPV